MPLAGFDATVEIKTSCQRSAVSDAAARGRSVYSAAALRGRFSVKYAVTHNKTKLHRRRSVTMAEGDNKSANMLVSMNKGFLKRWI